MVLCVMWAFWKARNDRRHETNSWPITKAIHWALDSAFDLWNAGTSNHKGGFLSPMLVGDLLMMERLRSTLMVLSTLRPLKVLMALLRVIMWATS